METIEDIIKELSEAEAQDPGKWIYRVCRIRGLDQFFDKAISPPRIEYVTLKNLAIRINSANMNIRRSLGRIYELSKAFMNTSDSYKLAEALYKIFKEARPFENKEESEMMKGENYGND